MGLCHRMGHVLAETTIGIIRAIHPMLETDAGEIRMRKPVVREAMLRAVLVDVSDLANHGHEHSGIVLNEPQVDPTRVGV